MLAHFRAAAAAALFLSRVADAARRWDVGEKRGRKASFAPRLFAPRDFPTFYKLGVQLRVLF